MIDQRIAFVTTCKGRAAHLKQTLPRNLLDNADYPNAVFVIIDYGSPDDLGDWLRISHAAELESGRVVLYSYKTNGKFHMAHAKNVAHRCGLLEGADLLCNLDADQYSGVGFARYLAEEFAADQWIFLWARMVKGQMPRGVNGRIAVTRDAYLKVGGYDEKFDTWSRDDKDFCARMKRAGYEAKEIDTRFLDGVRHNNKLRFREYPHAANNNYDDDLQVAEEEESTIANFGRYGLADVHRNFGAESLTLGPVPTRIFGIGLHKTGTTSLHHALKILGFDSAHWKDAHWAKAIWMEMKSLSRSETLERSYALSDLPIPILFRELDTAYRGSKFILTIRDDYEWLRSVEAHWSQRNQFRQQWASDPFTHKVHKIVYGQAGFDAQVMLDRYRRHNKEVLEYFSERPGDLLVMHVNGNMDWEALCSFLNRPVPDVPYPKANGTSL